MLIITTRLKFKVYSEMSEMSKAGTTTTVDVLLTTRQVPGMPSPLTPGVYIAVSWNYANVIHNPRL